MAAASPATLQARHELEENLKGLLGTISPGGEGVSESLAEALRSMLASPQSTPVLSTPGVTTKKQSTPVLSTPGVTTKKEGSDAMVRRAVMASARKASMPATPVAAPKTAESPALGKGLNHSGMYGFGTAVKGTPMAHVDQASGSLYSGRDEREVSGGALMASLLGTPSSSALSATLPQKTPEDEDSIIGSDVATLLSPSPEELSRGPLTSTPSRDPGDSEDSFIPTPPLDNGERIRVYATPATTLGRSSTRSLFRVGPDGNAGCIQWP